MSTIAGLNSTTDQALPLHVIAKRLSGVSEAALRIMVREGRVPAQKVGRCWWLWPSDVARDAVLGPLFK